ncbi:NnrU family protein [Nitrincola alkalilacustris]|uniref:NnrU family protein n=1 Tax=Nitrincola alkalilacustris TaxID=1571224 RepID=UPI00124C56B7|nr:NnrU family protein [Nitrincola alkalilacustris]
MLVLILGLLIFLGVHSIRFFADDWRSQQVARLGELPWKGIFTVVSLLGFVLIVWGYGLAKADTVWLWIPPVWTRHLAALLTLPAFILLLAAYIPGSRIRSKLGHPMLAGTKIWAFAHLISNGTLAAVLLFGSFMVWSIVGFAASRRRDRATGVIRAPGSLKGDLMVIVAGVVAWMIFAMYLHGVLIGVKPFG